MVLHNPNNWHWVNKDAREWAQKYFDDKLTVLSASSGDTSVKVDKVLSVEGDVDVSQRKGKVITLFDVKVRLEFSGSTASDPSVSGTITIPEVAHDTEEDEYVFETDIYSDTPTKSSIRDLIRSKLIPQLRVALGKFSGDLIAEHGKDIQHAPGTGPSYTPSAPVVPAAAAASSSSSTVKKSTSSGPIVNTVTLMDSIEFQTSAELLYSVFVDPGRVTAWSRSTPKIFEPKVGGAFSLFGGNVEGEFKVLEKDAKIVQSWRLGGWAKGHHSTLTLFFDQGSDSTTLRMTWDGVPVGEEEVTKRNFGEYYVKSIKQTFGYATLPPRVYRNPTTSLSPSSTALPVVAGGSAMAFAAKVFVAFVVVPVMAVVLLPAVKQALWDEKLFSL